MTGGECYLDQQPSGWLCGISQDFPQKQGLKEDFHRTKGQE